MQHSFEFLSDSIVRIQFSEDGSFPGCGLNRYGFIKETLGDKPEIQTSTDNGLVKMSSSKLALCYDQKTGQLQVADANGKPLVEQIALALDSNSSTVRFKAQDEEDWIGFGDQTRERLYHRGHTANCYVANVSCYVPVPYFMSTNGAAMLVNTTHRVVFDMCHTDPGEYFWIDGSGRVDYYVFAGGGFGENLNLYTELTGKPELPPEWAFGLWYICRTQANDYEAVNDALNFRREKIPCDVLGLEPGWMEKNYDLSTGKKWSDERFPIPSYCQNGPHNFIDAIKRMGFKMELWLAQEYDLSYEEERRIGNEITRDSYSGDAFGTFDANNELDVHFMYPRMSDKLTKPEEPWFEHLKKFVDQGADFFKQDGANQVNFHPDRVWANGMDDREMHNLYPLLYSRQMGEGFSEHTGRRPVVFTVAGWTGFQSLCGTWTGDTGGRLETLGAMLNTSIVGHSWATNDMEVMQKEGIHFGYLQPWSQINSWNYFRMPWVQGEELCDMHRDYAQLRATLVPYLYSWGYQATRTGWPLMAPLTLEFPEETPCRNNLNQYLLGRDLLVGIYQQTQYFPAGAWKDFWTGEVITGPCEKEVSWPENRGGSLYIREGAIIPRGPLMQYRGEKPLDEIQLYCFPGTKPSSFVLYEDDGVTFNHKEGQNRQTSITLSKQDGEVNLTIKTQGGFAEACGKRTWSVTLAVDAPPKKLKVNGVALAIPESSWDRERGEVTIDNCLVQNF